MFLRFPQYQGAVSSYVKLAPRNPLQKDRARPGRVVTETPAMARSRRGTMIVRHITSLPPYGRSVGESPTIVGEHAP